MDEKISIVIPTLNAEKYIRTQIERIFAQTIKPCEVIYIDSTSNDNTQKIILEYIEKNLPIKLKIIKREEFNHGRTRNEGAFLSKGNIIVFMTQDAIPYNEVWLENLIKPFGIRDDVACVFARQMPFVDATPIIKRELINHFNSFKSEDSDYTFQKVDFNDRNSLKEYNENKHWFWFNSNVCSAVRRDIFLQIKFKEIPYAEDQVFGKEIIEKGFCKVYAHNAIVLHSHNYTLIKFFKRYFDEYRGLKVSLDIDLVNKHNVLKVIFGNIVQDVKYIFNNVDKRKAYWFIYSIVFEIIRGSGAFLGSNYDKIPLSLQKYLSLEGKAIKPPYLFI